MAGTTTLPWPSMVEIEPLTTLSCSDLAAPPPTIVALPDTPLIRAAWHFAAAAHASVDQRRDYTGAPYIAHPCEVAALIASVPHDEAMIAAALLHDVLEDTPVPQSALLERFGEDVTDLVVWVTKPDRPETGGRDVWETAICAKLAAAPPRAQTIKVGDIYVNLATIADHDPRRALSYVPKKQRNLVVMTRADAGLHARTTMLAEDVLRRAGLEAAPRP